MAPSITLPEWPRFSRSPGRTETPVAHEAFRPVMAPTAEESACRSEVLREYPLYPLEKRSRYQIDGAAAWGKRKTSRMSAMENRRSTMAGRCGHTSRPRPDNQTANPKRAVSIARITSSFRSSACRHFIRNRQGGYREAAGFGMQKARNTWRNIIISFDELIREWDLFRRGG